MKWCLDLFAPCLISTVVMARLIVIEDFSGNPVKSCAFNRKFENIFKNVGGIEYSEEESYLGEPDFYVRVKKLKKFDIQTFVIL